MKKIVICLILALAMIFGLSACTLSGGTNPGGQQQIVNPGNNGDSSGNNSGSQEGGSQGGQDSGGSQSGSQGGETVSVATYKTAASNKLDEIVNPVLAKLPAGDLKTAIINFYNAEIQYINGLFDVEEAKTAVNKIVNDTKTFAIQTLKPLAIEKINSEINPLIQKITNEELRASVSSFYATEIAKINGIQSLDDVVTVYKEIIEDTKTFIQTETVRILAELKNKALGTLDTYVTALIAKIPDEDLKADTEDFYKTEKALLEAVDSLEGVEPCVTKIKGDVNGFVVSEAKKIAVSALDTYVTALIEKIPYEDLKADTEDFYKTEKALLDDVDTFDDIEPCFAKIVEDLDKFAVSEMKKIAIAKLNELTNDGLAKIPNQNLKKDLTDYKDAEIEKLNAVEKIEDVPSAITTVLTETAAYVKDLFVKTIKDYMARLSQVESANAYDYLPDTMKPSYSNNLVTADDIDYNFETFVNVSDINGAGFGEQWQMILENVEQSKKIANVFNYVQTAIMAAGTTAEIVAENTEEFGLSYSYESDLITMSFTASENYFSAEFSTKNAINIPILGELKIRMGMIDDSENNEKSVLIDLGDFYKLKYIINENSYIMVTAYGLTIMGKSATRSTYLSIEKDANTKETIGHIYENTAVVGSELLKACVDFYVDENYVSVVGNKASGIVGLKGYINELYNVKTGKLLGYEVLEERNMPIVGEVRFNTLWFNLSDVSGINSIKLDDDKVYLNGSTVKMGVAKNTLTRKYDIELRSRFFYSYDSENEVYVAHEVKIPMLFIQEENFETFVNDFADKNDGMAVSVVLSNTYLNKIMADYDTLIDVFKANKDLITTEMITESLSDD